MSAWLKNHTWIFTAFLAVFFVCAQMGNIAHATTNDSTPHNHDGKICVLSVLSNEDDGQDDLAIPPTESSLERPTLEYAAFTDITVSIAQEQPINTTARSPPGK